MKSTRRRWVIATNQVWLVVKERVVFLGSIATTSPIIYLSDRDMG
jgi:hypothetical protein